MAMARLARQGPICSPRSVLPGNGRVVEAAGVDRDLVPAAHRVEAATGFDPGRFLAVFIELAAKRSLERIDLGAGVRGKHEGSGKEADTEEFMYVEGEG